MLIRISAEASVAPSDGGTLEESVRCELDGAVSEEHGADHLDVELADLGIVGGQVRLRREGDSLRVVSEYFVPATLDNENLNRLTRDTVATWCDGIGEHCFLDLADRLGVDIDLVPLAEARDLRVEQLDDGVPPGPPPTRLATAARLGDVATMAALLAEGANIDVRLQRYTPLHLAILYRHEEAALLLIERGADVGARDPLGQDPLMLLAGGSLDEAAAVRVTRALLARGAKVSAMPPEFAELMGFTSPSEAARQFGRDELAALLESADR
jgi:hypothetical protein